MAKNSGDISIRHILNRIEYEPNRPLYALTIKEFVELAKGIVSIILNEQKPPTPPPLEKDEHLSIQECALFLKCSEVTIHNYKKAGLPFYRIGRTVMFKKSEVLEFMKVQLNKKRNK